MDITEINILTNKVSVIRIIFISLVKYQYLYLCLKHFKYNSECLTKVKVIWKENLDLSINPEEMPDSPQLLQKLS